VAADLGEEDPDAELTRVVEEARRLQVAGMTDDEAKPEVGDKLKPNDPRADDEPEVPEDDDERERSGTDA
jgi:hypothetical protein